MRRQIFVYIIFAIFGSLLAEGVLFLVARPPRGEAVTLLPPPEPAPVIVHISGAVMQPGVYSLPAGSRMQDAIQAAGGLLPEADDATLNLAAPLQDGGRLIVSARPSTATPSVPITMGTPGDSQSPSVIAKPGGFDSEALININTATKEALDTLPGIGPTIADRIIDYRIANGAFASIEDLQNVKGIGPATFEKLKNLITVGQ